MTLALSALAWDGGCRPHAARLLVAGTPDRSKLAFIKQHVCYWFYGLLRFLQEQPMAAMRFAGMELGVPPPLLQVPASWWTRLPPVCGATARRMDNGGIAYPSGVHLVDGGAA